MAISLATEPGCLVDLTGKHYRRHALARLCAIANGGKLVANQPNGFAMTLVEPDSGRDLCMLWHNAPISASAFSPDARTFATGTGDGCVHLWNIATGEAIARFEPRAGDVIKMQFSLDSRKLAALTFVGSQGFQGTLGVFIWEGVDGP